MIHHILTLNEMDPVCCARYLLLFLVIASVLRSVIQDSALGLCFVFKDGILCQLSVSDRDRRPVAL